MRLGLANRGAGLAGGCHSRADEARIVKSPHKPILQPASGSERV